MLFIYTHIDSTAERVWMPSPSGTDLWTRCKARWTRRYVDHVKEPEGQKAALGTRCHSIAADYLKLGTPPDMSERFELQPEGKRKVVKVFYPGRIVANVLPQLPAAGSVEHVERPLTLVHRGVTFKGTIDVDAPSLILDHKFTTSLDYMKSDAELEIDSQHLIYGADKLARVDGDVIQSQRSYGTFDRKARHLQVLPATRADITRGMNERILPLVDAMADVIARKPSWLSMPRDGVANRECSKFPPLGCPYAADCPRTLTERVQAAMSYLTRTKQAQQAAPAAVHTPAATSTARVAPQQTSLPEPPEAIDDAQQLIAGAINPPGESDAARAELAKAVVVNAIIEAKTAAAPARTRGMQKAAVEDLDAPKAAAKLTPDQRRAVVNHIMEAPVAAPAAVTAATPVTAEAAEKQLTLLVDVLPERGVDDVVYGTDLIAQAHEFVRKAMNTPDYRLGKEAAFGQGAGALCSRMDELVFGLPDDSIVVLSTSTPEGALVLETIRARATTILRGVR